MEIMVAKINDEYLSKYCEKCVVDKSGEDSLVLDGIWGIWYTICAWIDGHVVGALHFCRDKGDAGEKVGEVVHRLPCLVSQI